MDVRHRGSPVTVMMLALLFSLSSAAVFTFLATFQPRIGVTFVGSPDGTVLLAADDAAALAPGLSRPVRVLGLAPDGAPDAGLLPLTASDLVPEPSDGFATYAAMDAFFERQSELADALARGPVRLRLSGADGAEAWVPVDTAAERSLSDLPPVYWFQVAVGVLGVLLSIWVWALRRGDWATRLFALVGLSMLGFTHSAAVYSTRDLAMDGGLFRLLSDINAAGALTFGAAMIGVFLGYPRRLVPPALLALPALLFGGWLAAHVMRLPPGPGLGAHLPTLLEMLGIVAAIAAQWWATRRDPVGRAALRWLGLSVILGAGAFVTLMSVPVLVGGTAPLSQGYAFGFFLLIHAGLTLGLRRYRLFELGDWAFRVMLATLGLCALLAVDAALVLVLHLDHGLSLGLSMLAVGFLYLPLRDALMRRIVSRRTMPEHELFGAVMDVAFVAAPDERAAAWRGLLRRLFDPLELVPADGDPRQPTVSGEGLVMTVPPIAGAGALTLSYPWGGRGLFTPAQLAMTVRLCELMARAENGREAYTRGGAAERRRIARDLHDDLGARLLAALHQPDLPRTRAVAREAMADVRTIVSGLTGDRLPLDQVLGDLRHETVQRLDGTGIGLDWPVSAGPDPFTGHLVHYPVYRAVTATVREAVSNAIRHSGATRLKVDATLRDGGLRLVVEDDGQGRDAASGEPVAGGGHGLGNMARRAAELGGRLVFPESARGFRLELVLPLDATTGPGPAADPRATVPA